MNQTKVLRKPALAARLLIDCVCLATLMLALALGAELPAVDPRLLELLDGRRTDLYGALLALHSALLGFVLAAFTIVLGYGEGPRLGLARESTHSPRLYGSFAAAIRALAFGTIGSVVALLLDRDGQPVAVLAYLAIAVTLLASARLGRVLLLLERIVNVLVQPLSRDVGEPR